MLRITYCPYWTDKNQFYLAELIMIVLESFTKACLRRKDERCWSKLPRPFGYAVQWLHCGPQRQITSERSRLRRRTSANEACCGPPQPTSPSTYLPSPPHRPKPR